MNETIDAMDSGHVIARSYRSPETSALYIQNVSSRNWSSQSNAEEPLPEAVKHVGLLHAKTHGAQVTGRSKDRPPDCARQSRTESPSGDRTYAVHDRALCRERTSRRNVNDTSKIAFSGVARASTDYVVHQSANLRITSLQQCSRESLAIIRPQRSLRIGRPTVRVNERLNPTLSATPPCVAPLPEPAATPLPTESGRQLRQYRKKDLRNLRKAQALVRATGVSPARCWCPFRRLRKA